MIGGVGNVLCLSDDRCMPPGDSSVFVVGTKTVMSRPAPETREAMKSSRVSHRSATGSATVTCGII